MSAISSNHYSNDDQIRDVVHYLETFMPDKEDEFLKEFPKWPNLEWSGSSVDTEASGVDPDYVSWIVDWVEANTSIYWEDGEPWVNDDHSFAEDVILGVRVCQKCGYVPNNALDNGQMIECTDDPETYDVIGTVDF